MPIVHITTDPNHPHLVIVTNTRGDRATMTPEAVIHTCNFADNLIIDTDRVGWDGWTT